MPGRRVLAEAGIPLGADGIGCAPHLSRRLDCALASADLAPYLAHQTLAPGEPADTMDVIEAGQASIEMEIAGRPSLRLRTTRAGTLIGEIACRVVGLGREAMPWMEREQPDPALKLQRFLILERVDKVADTNRLIEAESRQRPAPPAARERPTRA